MQDKGILLIATGHPYYSHMAFNLLVSIRYHVPNMPIAIIQDGQGFNLLADYQREEFTHVIDLPKELTEGDPYRIKLHLDELTPFKKTLFLDVDMLWGNFKSPSDLFNELEGNEFTIISRSELTPEDTSLSRWFNLKEASEAYKLDTFYDVSSELIYFEGKPKVFQTARKVYLKPKMNIAPFGAGLPDEAFFMIAIAKEGIKLHQCPFEPTYWEPRYHPKQHSRQHIDGFYAMSVGGAFSSNHIKKIYDSLSTHYHNSSGRFSEPYQLQNKSRIFKERRKI